MISKENKEDDSKKSKIKIYWIAIKELPPSIQGMIPIFFIVCLLYQILIPNYFQLNPVYSSVFIYIYNLLLATLAGIILYYFTHQLPLTNQREKMKPYVKRFINDFHQLNNSLEARINSNRMVDEKSETINENNVGKVLLTVRLKPKPTSGSKDEVDTVSWEEFFWRCSNESEKLMLINFDLLPYIEPSTYRILKNIQIEFRNIHSLYKRTDRISAGDKTIGGDRNLNKYIRNWMHYHKELQQNRPMIDFDDREIRD